MIATSCLKLNIIGEQRMNTNYLSLISEYRKQIGNNILKMKVLKNVSSQNFAKALGISTKQLDKYEKGIETIPEELLAKIAEIAKIDIKNWNLSVSTNGKPALDKKILYEMMKHYLDLKKAQEALEKLEG